MRLAGGENGSEVNRGQTIERVLSRREPWDIVVIGGGATGVGIALDAAARRYQTLLIEQHDFGKGTSSRSTKLVHGGVRYLEQGNLPLVIEALRERGILRRNAPHLDHELPFVVPSYSGWEGPFYWLGLKLYQALSGRHGFGKSEWLSRGETRRRLPNLKAAGLRGGVIYYDGQFDDARLLIHLVLTAAEQGAMLLNYTCAAGLTRDSRGGITGVIARDHTGLEWTARARVVINAAGPQVDAIRRMAEPEARSLIVPSQGAHVVLDRSFLAGDTAIMVPRTPDRRVMFAIPWHGHTLVGTTDTPIDSPALEPVPMDQEIEFILGTAGRYLERKPTRSDVRSVFAGIRPLVRTGVGKNTASLSRGHAIRIDPGGLLTITGGKWTTYRNMAEDCVDQAAMLAGLPRTASVTHSLRIHGYNEAAAPFDHLSVYGSDAVRVQELARNEPALGQPLHPALPVMGAEVVWAVRHEMAVTVEDVLARRTRALFLNAAAAWEMAPEVARLMGMELGWNAALRDAQISAFQRLARGYLGRSGAGESHPVCGR
jgi:glycerol-3-phosphate dehydrogenase